MLDLGIFGFCPILVDFFTDWDPMGRFIFLCLFFWCFFLTDWDPMVNHHQTTIWDNIVWNLFQASKSRKSKGTDFHLISNVQAACPLPGATLCEPKRWSR